MLYYEVLRGGKSGIRLYPHRFKDGLFHLMLEKGGETVRVKSEADIRFYLDHGYRLRMSNRDEGHSPSLIKPSSIQGR